MNAQPWHCPRCGAEGVVHWTSDEAIITVLDRVQDEHLKTDPRCYGPIRMYTRKTEDAS